MAYADERGRKEQEPSNPINTGRVPDSVRFAEEAAARRNESSSQTNDSNPFGDWLNKTYPTYTGSRDPDTFYNNRENSYINWASLQSNGQQNDMLFPTDWGGTTIGPKEEEEPQHNDESQDNPISAPKPVTPQKAEEPLPEEPVDTGASSRVPLPEPVEPIVPSTTQGGRDDNEAFRRVVDRGNRSDDESEFWSGNPLFPTDYGGTTIPGMPGVSTPKPEPVTRDQFLEGASNFLNPLMNFGVPTATGESEYTPRPYNEDARRAVEVDRALRSLGTIPGNVQGYMNENGLEPSWLLTPAGREMLNDMPNSPLNAGTAEPTAGVNSFTDALVRPGNQYSNPLASAIGTAAENYALGNLLLGINSPLAPILNIPGGSDIVAGLAGNVLQNLGNDVGEYADAVRDYNNDLSDIPSQNPYETIIDYPTETPFEPAPPTPVVTPVDLSTTEQSYTPQDTSNPVNNSETNRPSQTDIANYIYMLRSNPFLADIDRNLLSGMDFNTRNVILQGANNEYQNLLNKEIQDRLYTENSFVPMRNEGDISVSPDWRNGGDIGNVWQEVLNSEYFLDDNGMAIYINPDGTFTQPVVDADGNITYKPYTGNVHRQNKYSPDDILGFFLNENYGHPGHEGEPLFKGMEQMWENLTEEEKAGMNELLNTGIFGGSNYRDPNRNGVFDQEFADLSEAEYSRLAQLFYDNMPALQLLNENGLLNRYDENGNLYMDGYSSIIDFFFKAFKRDNAPKTPKNYKGGYSRRGGYGGRGRGGGGGGGGYGGYGSSSSSSNQRQNRVYNIMKNWSF